MRTVMHLVRSSEDCLYVTTMLCCDVQEPRCAEALNDDCSWLRCDWQITVDSVAVLIVKQKIEILTSLETLGKFIIFFLWCKMLQMDTLHKPVIQDCK